MDQHIQTPGREFNPDPEESYTIPAHLYFDSQFLEDEKREIFWKSWILVAPVARFSEPGAYVTADVAGQGAFVIRSRDGGLNGFFNVCQHRGHSLLKGNGKSKSLITCPYHAWAYDHDGALIAANNCAHVKNFQREEFSLQPVQVEEYGGFVFVNLDPGAMPMDEVYPGAREALARFCANPAALIPGPLMTSEIAGNWKTVGDNRLECYHCSTAHKDFIDLIRMDTYRTEIYENWSLQIGKGRRENAAYSYTPEDGPDAFLSLYLWPSTSFTIVPGTRGLGAFTFVPAGPETTHQEYYYCQPEPELTSVEQAFMTYLGETISPEDVALVEDVQKGLHSLGYRPGRIMVDETRSEISEHAVHHFHSLIMKTMRDYV